MAITVLLSQSKAIKLFKYFQHLDCPIKNSVLKLTKELHRQEFAFTFSKWWLGLQFKNTYLLKITCDSCDEQSHLKQSEPGGSSQDTEGVVGAPPQHTHTDLSTCVL